MKLPNLQPTGSAETRSMKLSPTSFATKRLRKAQKEGLKLVLNSIPNNGAPMVEGMRSKQGLLWVLLVRHLVGKRDKIFFNLWRRLAI